MLEENSPSTWEEFNTLLTEFINFSRQYVKIPSDEVADPLPRQDSPDNPKFIQALYRRNRRRAIRKVIGENTKQCDEDPNALAEHFFNSNPKEVDNSVFDDWQNITQEINLESINPSEVWSSLSKAENTAPGIDKLTYNHWKTVDPEGHALATIFSLCLKFEKIPDEWKRSRTVFIPKKEDCQSLSDWRPISLCNTISKLFTGCPSKRLIDWVTGNDVLCPAQKGFMPYDGAFENNYVFQQKLQYARRAPNRELCAPSIDLSNAFGSVSHSSIRTSLCCIWRREKIVQNS